MRTERQKQVCDILRHAARDFERNGLSRGAIRKCEEEAPDLFLSEGLRVLLLDADESAGYRFLSLLLTRIPAVFQKLCDRWYFTRQESISIARCLHRVDLNFDTRMAALLPDSLNTPKQFALEGEFAERALEVLDEISPGRRIVPIMRHLTEHSDSKIASKAGLLIGKRLQNLAWARRVVAESPDSRIRANAIECFWGMNAPAVIDLFHDCLVDEDNRVVGNAIIGLHEAGDPEAFDWISRIAADDKPDFRMTAAWIMGRIGDQSFVSLLGPLAKDSHPEVRRAALRSLRTFREAEKRTSSAVELPMPEPEQEPEPVEIETVPAVPVSPQRQFWG